MSIVKLLKNTLVILLGFLIVQVIFSIFKSRFIFPSPFDVMKAAYRETISGDMMIHVAMSLKRVCVGYIFAAFIAIPLGIFCAAHRNVAQFIIPYMELLRPIPPIAWIPIAILLFGLGDISTYFIVFLGSFFPIFSNTFFGASSLNRTAKWITATFELPVLVIYTKILLPFALPHIFIGLKVGIGMAWMSLIASELIGAQSGLGYFIQLNRLLLQFDNVIAGMVIIGSVGYALSVLIESCEKFCIPWKKQYHR